MKNPFFTVVFLLLLHSSYAQKNFTDSLKEVIERHKEDTVSVNTLAVLANSSGFVDAVNYAKQGLQLAQKISYEKGEADCNLVLSASFARNGSAMPCIQYALNGLSIY